MKLSTKTIIILSEMLDKMGIKDEIKNIEGKTNEEVGKDLLIIITTKLYKVEDLIYKLISEYKCISEDEAKEVDFIETIKEIINIDGLKDFLALKQD